MPVEPVDDEGSDDKKERITIRVTEKEFEEIDRKRRSFGVKTKLQPFGHRLLLAWARDEIGNQSGPAVAQGEFVKCPKHLIPVIQGVINELSNPAEYEAILREGALARAKGHGIKKVK